MFAHRTAAIDCVVRNLSECGAFLKVFSPLAFLTRLNFGLNRIQSAVVGWFGEKPLRREDTCSDPCQRRCRDPRQSRQPQRPGGTTRCPAGRSPHALPATLQPQPIEQLFAKLKHLVRKAEPRTIEATWRKAGQILDLFSPAECANYLKNSGYASV
jgi:hypothetical protein